MELERYRYIVGFSFRKIRNLLIGYAYWYLGIVCTCEWCILIACTWRFSFEWIIWSIGRRSMQPWLCSVPISRKGSDSHLIGRFIFRGISCSGEQWCATVRPRAACYAVHAWNAARYIATRSHVPRAVHRVQSCGLRYFTRTSEI